MAPRMYARTARRRATSSMSQDLYLTGNTTTATTQICNYVVSIRPGIEASKDLSSRLFFCLEVYHSLSKN